MSDNSFYTDDDDDNTSYKLNSFDTTNIDENSIEDSFIVDSDANESKDGSIPKTPKNISFNFKNTSNLMRDQKQIISSDSEDDTPNNIHFKTRKARNIIDSDSEDDHLVEKNIRNFVESDSDDNFSRQSKLQTTIESDSEENVVSNSEEDVPVIVQSGAVSDDDQEITNDDVRNISTKLNGTKLNAAPTSSPLISSNAKRSLNRSVDTPRIIKQIKESKTPSNPRDSFSPKFQSTIFKGSSDDNDEDDSDVIEVSSEDEVVTKHTTQSCANKTVRQTTLDAHVKPSGLFVAPHVPAEIKEEAITPEKIEVTRNVYQQQQIKVQQFQADVQKALNVLRTVNLNLLPDKGVSVKIKHQALEKALLEEVKTLSKMVVTKERTPFQNRVIEAKNSNAKILTWDQLEEKASAVQPKTFGKQAMSTYNAQKAVTMDKLQQLHSSLKNCPKETDFVDDPKGLKVELMPHQKHALGWLLWREKQKPSGGILADDMGLGKTLTMISLLLKSREVEDESTLNESETENTPARSSKPDGGTLVVCPASLISQWSGELEKRTKRGLASWEMYHGPKRETNAKRLAEHDMVITTYAIVNNESEKNGTIFRVRWRRIVLDEAHQIRNHKSQTSIAVCKLPAKSRWALTGTPVHNKELDMYALLKYLRCTPFDDLQVWKRWVGDKSTGGQERLHTVISSLMLRRTKAELIEKGTMTVLPERNWVLVPVQLSKNEFDVYNRILIFSRKLFAQFLHQRAEKNQDAIDVRYNAIGEHNEEANKEYFVMRQKLLRLNKVKDIKQHEILVLLLRLRQICCHPSLITGMLHEDMTDLGDHEDEESSVHREELDLLEQLNNLTLDTDKFDESAVHHGIESKEEGAGLKEAAKGLLNPNDPIFSKQRPSSKIKAVLDVLKDKVLDSSDKAIIVSQWPSFLNLIGMQLKANHVRYDQLDGKVPVNKRMEMVDAFNDPNNKLKVLLLSLTAGGVGLNLVGGNHLFLLDLHWNPQLENQAQDRIYRVGQQKTVYVYKFMASDTIEKRILDLQEKKLSIANAMLTGTKQAIVNKLSLQDLKMLFEM